MESVTPRHTDFALGLRCSNCGEPLSLMPGRTQLTFQCKGGHSFLMRQLFSIQARDVVRGLRAVLGIWEEKIAVLEKSAEFAREEGRDELSQTFHREADLLRARMQAIREQLAGAGTGSGGAVAG